MVQPVSGRGPRGRGPDGRGRRASGSTPWTTQQRTIGTGAVPGADGTAPDAERLRWFYTPTDHGGLTVHQQRPAQQRLAMRAGGDRAVRGRPTSPSATVMGLENVLDRVEGFG